MVMDKRNGQMDHLMMDNIKMGKSAVLVNLSGQMEQPMKVNG